MEFLNVKAHPSQDRRRWFIAPAVVITTTVLVFGSITYLLTLRLRDDFRAQILQREAEALRSMVQLQEERAKAEFEAFGVEMEAGDWFPLLLETSRLRGVVALRLFDERGTLRDALPMPLTARVTAADWSRLRTGASFARLRQHVEPTSLQLGDPEIIASGGAPILEVLVSLREPTRGAFGGAAQYWIDGAGMQQEFAALDRSLWLRSGVAAAVGIALVLGALAWAFYHLRLAHRQVQARSEDLARANREFSLAAKTSALGTITAHLIHGLRNPLAGLEGYVSNQSRLDRDVAGDEWRAAMETTQRIRTLVNEVVAILREEDAGGAKYRVTTTELLAAVEAKIRPLAAARSITFHCPREGSGELPGRRAHLVLLVLDNLLRNACEATPPGTTVSLSVEVRGRDVVFAVEDEGPGLPRTVRDNLFQPVASTKAGGGGIGLAISHQLAQHAGGLLTLEKSDIRGCRFRLAVPVQVDAPAWV